MLRPKTPTILGSLAVGFLTISSPLFADEVRLSDGRVLYGDVTERRTTLLVETADGLIQVQKDEVVRRRSEEELGAEVEALAGRAGDNSGAWLEVARLARRYRLSDAMWTALSEADTRANEVEQRARVTEVLATLEDELLPPHHQRRDSEFKIQQFALKVRDVRSPIELRAIEAVLSNYTDGSEALQRRVRVVQESLKRRVLIGALWSMSDEGDDEQSLDNRRFVYRRAMFERDPELRGYCLGRAIETDGGVEAAAYLGSALNHSRVDIRVRGAEALGALGTPEAARALLTAAPRAASANVRAPRAHIAVVRQQAFIQDFDVEVAQSAAVANPVVGVLQSGVVLDVAVLGSVEVRTQLVGAYRRALHRIAGSDPGPDVAAWEAWWQGVEEARRQAAKQAEETAAGQPGTESEPTDGGLWKRDR